jgi:microsomal dipeptidase-like Zn-dependent dipeptidase
MALRRNAAQKHGRARKYALSNHAELPSLRERLGTRGYGGDALEKIMGGNAIRVFRPSGSSDQEVVQQ